MLSQAWWEQVVKLEHLEIVQSWGSKPVVDRGVPAVEVGRRNAEAANCTLTPGEDGLWKVRIIIGIIFTDMFSSKKVPVYVTRRSSSGVAEFAVTNSKCT